ncbi:MAG: RadC family protein [Candidatus Woesearchaeota archaeon]
MFIRELNLNERPREKLIRLGVKSLDSSELLALVLRTGSKSENVIDLSRRLIGKFGLENLNSCSLNELQVVKGVGLAKACQVIALFELASRCSVPQSISVKSPSDVFSYFRPFVSGFLKEYFFILMLNTKNKILKHEVVSVGTLDSSLVHPREVFRPALKEGCFSVILVHNHPSGDPSPSDDDLVVTERLIEAGKLLGVSVLDHVILGRDSFWSYKHDS